MRIVLLGPQGSGKGPLSEKIASHYDIPIITMHSVLKRAAAEGSELGRLAREAIDSARLSDELCLALLRIQMPQTDLANGFVLVDLPRNTGQADALDNILKSMGRPIDLVLKLDVDNDDLMERLVGRIICDNCGAQYNKYVNPPMVDGVCDECGARVKRRPGDYEETISNRLRNYDAQMGPLLQYYTAHEILRRINANHEGSKLWKRVKSVIDATPVADVAEPESSEKAGEIANFSGKKSAKSVKKKKTTKKASTEKKPAATKKTPGTEPSRPSRKKPVAKKIPAKKPAAKVVKKAAAKKAAAKKTSTKKKVAKKAAKKKTVKKVPAKKAVTKKKTAGKKKTVAKKKVAKKTAKKVTVKKSLARKATTKKKVLKKAAKKKAVKKVLAKKAVTKKKTAKKRSVKK